ncbi:hypothetical protein BC938DRAFT_476088 [Jimgerdemannia flammicorona]|uniref:Uncharacterized protein n=1 Tax=Jimgerdemannia flammicorona TaxID=994334 RepID=A0A433PKE3_9FUNG|nr:hypothetical protein BC938DRAFT_476088 [Jimgerdemannia flammicorona]
MALDPGAASSTSSSSSPTRGLYTVLYVCAAFPDDADPIDSTGEADLCSPNSSLLDLCNFFLFPLASAPSSPASRSSRSFILATTLARASASFAARSRRSDRSPYDIMLNANSSGGPDRYPLRVSDATFIVNSFIGSSRRPPADVTNAVVRRFWFVDPGKSGSFTLSESYVVGALVSISVISESCSCASTTMPLSSTTASSACAGIASSSSIAVPSSVPVLSSPTSPSFATTSGFVASSLSVVSSSSVISSASETSSLHGGIPLNLPDDNVVDIIRIPSLAFRHRNHHRIPKQRYIRIR